MTAPTVVQTAKTNVFAIVAVTVITFAFVVTAVSVPGGLSVTSN